MLCHRDQDGLNNLLGRRRGIIACTTATAASISGPLASLFTMAFGEHVVVPAACVQYEGTNFEQLLKNFFTPSKASWTSASELVLGLEIIMWTYSPEDGST